MPENPAATISPSRPGTGPSIGLASGVMSYTPVIPRAMPGLRKRGNPMRNRLDLLGQPLGGDGIRNAIRVDAARPGEDPTSVIAPAASGRK